MFIDFEGIDGSGKTTLSNQVAHRLRKMGYPVTHAREGGTLRAAASQRIRDITRDARLLELSPRSELLLNLARDAQQLEEVIRPALTRGELCITDRYAYSAMALAEGGRGLPASETEAAALLACQGIWPDLVVLVDVEPDLARMRKRISKLKDGREHEPPSRKGLAGLGLAARVRASLLERARREPDRWRVVENDDAPLWVLEQRIVEVVVARLEGRDGLVRRVAPPGRVAAKGPRTLETVEADFFRMLDVLEVREAALGALLLAGIPGLAAHRRRLAYAERFPGLIARGLAGLCDHQSFALRELLANDAPADVALSLAGLRIPQATSLRLRLLERELRPVVEGLFGDASNAAWSMRERALQRGELEAVLLGLGGVDSARAWELREQGLSRGLHGATARSLKGIAGERADAIRRTALAKERLAVIESLAGVHGGFARELRELLLEPAAKEILATVAGMETEHAYSLRERIAHRAPEALLSLAGSDDERAWLLRDQHAARWPVAAADSVGSLGRTERGQELLARILKTCPGKLMVVRSVYRAIAAAAAAQRPERAAAPHSTSRPELRLV